MMIPSRKIWGEALSPLSQENCPRTQNKYYLVQVIPYYDNRLCGPLRLTNDANKRTMIAINCTRIIYLLLLLLYLAHTLTIDVSVSLGGGVGSMDGRGSLGRTFLPTNNYVRRAIYCFVYIYTNTCMCV